MSNSMFYFTGGKMKQKELYKTATPLSVFVGYLMAGVQLASLFVSIFGNPDYDSGKWDLC